MSNDNLAQVTFSREDIPKMEQALSDALLMNQTSFDYKGNMYDTGYAKYLIEFLRMNFGIEEDDKQPKLPGLG